MFLVWVDLKEKRYLLLVWKLTQERWTFSIFNCCCFGGTKKKKYLANDCLLVWRLTQDGLLAFLISLKFNQDSQGILPVKFDGGVWPAWQNLWPIYNQNLRLSLPYLRPDLTFDTLFMTVAADTVALNISSGRACVYQEIKAA